MADGTSSVMRSLRAVFGHGGGLGLADDELLARFAAGSGDPSEAAFEAIVERHGPMVRRVCRDLLRDAHAADDAFQAVFLVLARRAGGGARPGPLGPWLYGVARRVAAHSRVDAARRLRHERAAGAAAERADVGEADDRLPALHEAIAALPDRYRSAVVLCDLEGMTHEEAAAALRCPAGTVKSRLSRGRDRIRDRLARRGFEVVPPLPAIPLAPALVRSAASGIASSTALALSRKAMPTMIATPWKLALATIAVAAGGALAYTLREAEPPPAPAPRPVVAPPPPAVKPPPGSVLQRADVLVEDLIAAYALEIYKFRLDVPSGRRFRLVFRKQETEGGPYEILQTQPFRKTSEGPTDLTVWFKPTDGSIGAPLTSSKEKWAMLNTRCEGCSQSYGSSIEIPFGDERAANGGAWMSYISPCEKLPDGALRLLNTGPNPKPGTIGPWPDYPHAELVVILDE